MTLVRIVCALLSLVPLSAYARSTCNIKLLDQYAHVLHGKIVVYTTIKNDDNAPARLLSIKSTAANNASVRQSYVDDKGVSRFTSIDQLTIPAQSVIEFKPGGIHIILSDIHDLNTKDSLNITLTFDRCTTQIVIPNKSIAHYQHD